jgi:hypothetical protein
MLDITTTATIRPSLLCKTLESFTKNLLVNQKDYRLILNVDPIGEDIDPMEVVNVGRSFFDNVVYNISNKPNFAQAVKWCWQTTDSELIFHMEDDWTLSRKILIDDMVSTINKNNNMMSLRLPQLSLKKVNKEDERNNFIKHHKLLLNPTLFKGGFIRDMASKMNILDNPEKQIRRKFKLSENKFAGIYCGLGNGEYIKHTGRQWQKRSNYHKVKGSNFITWERR